MTVSVNLHAVKLSFLDNKAEIVCKMGKRKASKVKRNLVSPVERFVRLNSELR